MKRGWIGMNKRIDKTMKLLSSVYSGRDSDTLMSWFSFVAGLEPNMVESAIDFSKSITRLFKSATLNGLNRSQLKFIAQNENARKFFIGVMVNGFNEGMQSFTTFTARKNIYNVLYNNRYQEIIPDIVDEIMNKLDSKLQREIKKYNMENKLSQ
jgi:hypothetical protein